MTCTGDGKRADPKPQRQRPIERYFSSIFGSSHRSPSKTQTLTFRLTSMVIVDLVDQVLLESFISFSGLGLWMRNIGLPVASLRTTDR